MRTRPSHLSAGRQRQFLSGDEGLLEVYYRPHDLAHPAAGLHKTSKLITETCIYRGLDRPSGHPDSKYAYRTTNLFLMFPAAVEGKRHVEVKDLHTVRNNLRYSRNYPTGIFPTRRKSSWKLYCCRTALLARDPQPAESPRQRLPIADK